MLTGGGAVGEVRLAIHRTGDCMKKQQIKRPNVRRERPPLVKETRPFPQTIMEIAQDYGVELAAGLLGGLQWEADAGDKTSAKIFVRRRAELQAGIDAGKGLAIAIMTALGERP